MNENQLKFLWDNYANNKGFSGYDEFKSLMANDNNRKLFFDDSNKELGFKDYNEFEGILGVKKKEPTTQDSGQRGEPSAPSFGQKITEKITNAATQVPFKTAQQTQQPAQEKKKAAPSKYFEVDITEPQDVTAAKPVVSPVEMERRQSMSMATPKKIAERETKQRADDDFYTNVASKEVFKMPTYFESKEYASDITGDYLNYLQQVDPEKGTYTNEKYKVLKAKSKEDRTATDEGFLRQVESEAVNKVYDANYERLQLLGSNIDDLEKIAVTPSDRSRLDYMYKEYEKVSDSLKGLAATYEQNNLQYGKIAGQEMQSEEDKRARFEKIQAGEGKTKEFFTAVADAAMDGILNTYQFPKVMGDLIGDKDYDWSDEFYDAMSGAKSTLDLDLGAPLPQGTSTSDLPFAARAALVGGNAIGTMGIFMLGGATGGATKLGQRAATFATSFLTQESNYYQEALDGGMSPQDAAITGSYLAAQMALFETIIPDIGYLNAAGFKKGVVSGAMQAMKSGLPAKEAAKLALKNALSALPENALIVGKNVVKSGGKEFFAEELPQNLAEDTAKEIINNRSQKAYFNDTFNPESYVDAAIGSFVAAGGTSGISSIFSKPTPKSPVQEEVMRHIVENRDKIFEKGTASDKTAGTEGKKQVDEAGEILDAMKGHSGWNEMSKQEQDHAFATAQQAEVMKKEQERMKKLRIPDEQKDAQIKQLEDEVNAMFAQQLEKQKQKKNDQENIQGISGEVGKGQEPVAAKPVEVPSEEAPATGGVLQAQEEVTPTETEKAPTPFQKQKDLLGEDKQAWMYEATEAERNQAKNAGGKNASKFFPKKISKIKFALDGGKFDQAIEEGRMTPQQAADIIYSADFEVPASIQSKLETATEAAPKAEEKAPTQAKPTYKERVGKMFKPKEEGETIVKISEAALSVRRAGAVEASEESNEDAGVESALEGVGLDETKLEDWKKKNKAPSKKGRIEEMTQAVRDLMSGKTRFKEYYEKAKQLMPSKPMDKVPTPASFEEVVGSIDKNKLKIGIMNLNKFVKKGTKVGLRIDIPAFNNFGKNIVTVHDKTGSGQPVIGYGSTGSISNVKFKTSVSTAAKIGSGEQKSAFAMAEGQWMDESPESIQARAEEALNSPEWVQVSMNPARNSFFFDKADGNPVIAADEVLQVGNLVLAKNPQKIDLNTKEGMAQFEKQFSAKTKEGVTYQYSRSRPSFGERVGKIFDTEGERAAEDLARFHKEAGIEVKIIDDVEAQRLGQERNMEGSVQGLFLADKGSGVIYLNRDALKRVGKTLVYHEGIHPVINIVRNTNPELYKKVIDGLRAEAKRNPAIARAIRQVEAVKEYQKRGPETIEDETIVEVLARIAAGDIDINKVDKSLKDSLIDFWNRIAKTLGIPQVKANPTSQEFRDFADKLSTALTQGGTISDVVGAENVKEFAPPPSLEITEKENITNYEENIPIPGVVRAGQPSVEIDRSTDTPIDVYQEKGVKKLPVKTLKQIYDKYNKKVVVINSDPTRVGWLTLPSGKRIFMYGGPGYLSVQDNTKGDVGFATTQESKVKSWKKYVDELFGNNPGVTLVATQAPTAILSNSYALRYVLDAISQLPKSVLKSSTFKNEFFGNDIGLLKDAFGDKKYNEFINKYKNSDLSNPEIIDNMISEMSYTIGNDNAPASFKARGAFVANLLGGLSERSGSKTVEGDKGYYSKKPQKYIASQLMDRLGINAEKVMRDIGEPGLVDLYINEGKWGFAVSGFETDPNIDIQSVQNLGVDHPLFNAKFPGKNAFLLDGAYEIDAMFKPIEMTGPKGAPYTKRASQMLAGSMYVKGGEKQGEQTFEYRTTLPSGIGVLPAVTPERITKASENLQAKFRRDGIPLSTQEAVEIVEELSSWKDWYDGIAQMVQDNFREYAADYMMFMFGSAVASNSAGTIGTALNNLERLYAQEEIKGLPIMKRNIYEILSGLPVTSDKIANFVAAGLGDKNAIPVDMHVWSFINSFPTTDNTVKEKDFVKAKEFVNAVADGLGWDPREVQAAMWAANMLRLGQRPDTYEEYIQKKIDAGLQKQIQGWRDKGYKPVFAVRQAGEKIETVFLQEEKKQEFAPKLEQVKKEIAEAAKKRTASKGQPSVDIDRSGPESQPLTEIDGQTTFFHASSKKREGRLKPNTAPQWGKAIYFATSRQAATDEFGGQNVTEASLSLKNPVYTNSKEFRAVQEKAAELYNKAMLPQILKDEAERVNGEWRFFDEDLQAEYDENGYIDRYSVSDIEEGKYFGEAAQELGHDAIIDQDNQYGTEIAVLDENAVVYPEDMKPKSDLDSIEDKGGIVYHGGDIIDLNSIRENEPLFVTESESEAIAYSKGNRGDVSVAKIDLSKIGDEKVARDILESMGYSDEYMLHELIDPRFEESYIGDNDVKKLYSEIKKQGYVGISFMDTGIAKKRSVTNIFLVSPKEALAKSGFETNKIVRESRSFDLLEQGYLPVIDGKVVQNPTEKELSDYFSKNEYLNMVKPSVSRGQFSADIERTSDETRQSMEDAGDAIEQAIAAGTDPQEAVDDIVGNKDWYKGLSEDQKQQFDEILQEYFGVTPKATGIKATIANIIDNYYKLKDKAPGARDAINQILDSDPKLKYIYDNIAKINKQLQDAGVITKKTDGCP